MRELSIEEKKSFGKELNDAKAYVESLINNKMVELEKKKLNQKL